MGKKSSEAEKGLELIYRILSKVRKIPINWPL
jgi:hypothetical protein